MNRREFVKLVIGTVCAAPLAMFVFVGKFPDGTTADELNEFLFRRGLRPCRHSSCSSDEDFAKCTVKNLCKTCGAPTENHIIDCTLPVGSAERARTTCMACNPAARCIEKYWYGFPSVMHMRTHDVKCSECGVNGGYIHETGKPFEYRLCGKCAPGAGECRRWVRDLRGKT
jgi:hypothetical protein